MTNTVTISDTVLKLDNLFASYEGIFDEVKRQLENLDIKDEHVDRIIRNLKSNESFQESLAKQPVVQLAHELSQLTQEEYESKKALFGLVDAVAMRVMDKLNDEFDAYLQARFLAYFTDDKLDDLLGTFLSQRPQIKEGFHARDTLTSMLDFLGYQPKPE